MAKTHISNSIRKFRFNAGEMTQQDLAKRVGVSRQTIVAVETGKYSPSLELAFKIAAVFKTSVEQIFIYEGETDE